jgi:hypothetical protein
MYVDLGVDKIEPKPALQTADKAVLEIFPKPGDSREEVLEVVRRAVSPGAEVGGDARLILPDERRIKTEVADIDGQVWQC